MCGASLLNNDDTDVTDHWNTETASVILLLTFQCLVTLGLFSVEKNIQYLHERRTSLGVCYIVFSVVSEYKVIPSNFDDISSKAGSLCERHDIPFVENVDKRW
jgi:hypothetical protein